MDEYATRTNYSPLTPTIHLPLDWPLLSTYLRSEICLYDILVHHGVSFMQGTGHCWTTSPVEILMLHSSAVFSWCFQPGPWELESRPWRKINHVLIDNEWASQFVSVSAKISVAIRRIVTEDNNPSAVGALAWSCSVILIIQEVRLIASAERLF